jgi:hypothetical protein
MKTNYPTIPPFGIDGNTSSNAPITYVDINENHY